MRKFFLVIPLALILCFFVGCQDKAAMAELEALKAQAAVEEQNKELVKSLVEEFGKGNIEIWKELCASDFAYYNPSETTEPMSLEQTIATFQMLYQSFPDYSLNTNTSLLRIR